MFKGLTTITEVHLENMLKPGYKSILSYMIRDCINLEKFTCNINCDEISDIKDIRGLFYNCVSLASFSFNELFVNCLIYPNSPYTNDVNSINCSYYTEINMSQMFYNCQNLTSIDADSIVYVDINDMREMFYNCISLTTINLQLYTNSHPNLS